MGWPCAGKRILKDQFQFSAGSNQASRDIYTVSRLNREVKTLLERQLGGIWIEGELSNLTLARSGHWYFSLKDDGAQTSCAMFKSRNSLLGFKPSEGNHVILRARVGLYEPRGQFQLVVEHMELAGEGMLQIKFEQQGWRYFGQRYQGLCHVKVERHRTRRLCPPKAPCPIRQWCLQQDRI